VFAELSSLLQVGYTTDKLMFLVGRNEQLIAINTDASLFRPILVIPFCNSAEIVAQLGTNNFPDSKWSTLAVRHHYWHSSPKQKL